MIDSGCEVIFLTSDQKKEFQDAVAPLYEKHCADHLDLIQEIRNG